MFASSLSFIQFYHPVYALNFLQKAMSENLLIPVPDLNPHAFGSIYYLTWQARLFFQTFLLASMIVIIPRFLKTTLAIPS